MLTIAEIIYITLVVVAGAATGLSLILLGGVIFAVSHLTPSFFVSSRTSEKLSNITIISKRQCPIAEKKQYQLLVEANIVSKQKTKVVTAKMYVNYKFFESCEEGQRVELGNIVYPISHVSKGGKVG